MKQPRFPLRLCQKSQTKKNITHSIFRTTHTAFVLSFRCNMHVLRTICQSTPMTGIPQSTVTSHQQKCECNVADMYVCVSDRYDWKVGYIKTHLHNANVSARRIDTDDTQMRTNRKHDMPFQLLEHLLICGPLQSSEFNQIFQANEAASQVIQSRLSDIMYNLSTSHSMTARAYSSDTYLYSTTVDRRFVLLPANSLFARWSWLAVRGPH